MQFESQENWTLWFKLGAWVTEHVVTSASIKIQFSCYVTVTIWFYNKFLKTQISYMYVCVCVASGSTPLPPLKHFGCKTWKHSTTDSFPSSCTATYLTVLKTSHLEPVHLCTEQIDNAVEDDNNDDDDDGDNAAAADNDDNSNSSSNKNNQPTNQPTTPNTPHKIPRSHSGGSLKSCIGEQLSAVTPDFPFILYILECHSRCLIWHLINRHTQQAHKPSTNITTTQRTAGHHTRALAATWDILATKRKQY